MCVAVRKACKQEREKGRQGGMKKFSSNKTVTVSAHASFGLGMVRPCLLVSFRSEQEEAGRSVRPLISVHDGPREGRRGCGNTFPTSRNVLFFSQYSSMLTLIRTEPKTGEEFVESVRSAFQPNFKTFGSSFSTWKVSPTIPTQIT